MKLEPELVAGGELFSGDDASFIRMSTIGNILYRGKANRYCMLHALRIEAHNQNRLVKVGRNWTMSTGGICTVRVYYQAFSPKDLSLGSSFCHSGLSH